MGRTRMGSRRICPRASKVNNSDPIRIPTPTHNVQAAKLSPPPSLPAMTGISNFYRRWCRPTLRDNYTRLEWHDRRGREYWADFAGSEACINSLAADLQQDGFVMDNITTTTPTTVSRQPTHPTLPAVAAPPSAPSPVTQTSASATSFRSVGKPVYLELCIMYDSTHARLGEVTIVDGQGQQLLETDVQLFAAIRQKYESMKRKGLFPYFYKPAKIHFVKFAVHDPPRVGIFAQQPSIPPSIEVYQQRYHYHPCPHNIGDDIMPTHFFYDYFWNWQKCDQNGKMWTNRLPKKLGSSMAAISTNGPELETHMAWGIHIIEGPRKMLLIIITVLWVILSILVATIYNARTGSKDTGVAIASWLLNMLAKTLPLTLFLLRNE